MIRIITFILLLAFTFQLQAEELVQHNPVPGGIALIELPDSPHPPKAFFQQHRVMVIRQDQLWLAVVGLPLTLKPGEQQLKLESSPPTSISFQVDEKSYESQHITVKNKRHVSPNEQDMKRIRTESALSKAALSHWSDSPSVLPELILPTHGRLSSPFGLRRYFNEQPRKPHSGIDIAAPKGTEIIAPADGTVIRQGEFFFNGKTLFIDHGQGLITMYCHMEEISVSEGEQLKQGQRLGSVGSTGRSTGPHLHWGVSLNNARIDPALLSPQLRKWQERKR